MGEGRGRLKEREMGGVREREIEWGVMGKERDGARDGERVCAHVFEVSERVGEESNVGDGRDGRVV